MTGSESASVAGLLHRVGQRTVDAVRELGFAATVVGEALFWLALGPWRRQRVHLHQIFAEAMEAGVRAIPIVSVLAMTIGVMLAIQGIHTLETFGAETQVTTGIALSVVREFGPLITGILVAGRSGSALAARIGTMRITQEIDALKVMGIAPVRFLVTPALLAMLVMMPCLAFWANALALTGGGLYVSFDLGMSLGAYFDRIFAVLGSADLLHGLGKSVIFGVLITIVGVVNGAMVSGGAEGVGRAATRAVVQSISAIVVTDMLFVLVLTR